MSFLGSPIIRRETVFSEGKAVDKISISCYGQDCAMRVVHFLRKKLSCEVRYSEGRNKSLKELLYDIVYNPSRYTFLLLEVEYCQEDNAVIIFDRSFNFEMAGGEQVKEAVFIYAVDTLSRRIAKVCRTFKSVRF